MLQFLAGIVILCVTIPDYGIVGLQNKFVVNRSDCISVFI